ncbi:uncharacterized protein LOC133929831 [Phragmites australis]|uniref:uncharacterized protein LOC133929831 n=1 Tax=Phragmites australis TaxID=29695 RepID=UPI002D789358|nr:uncharacterized protein LOC133929831 [Phragmites australis]
MHRACNCKRTNLGRRHPPFPTAPANPISQQPSTQLRAASSAMTLKRLLGLSAAASGRLRRGISTAASRPPWAMVYPLTKLKTPAPRVSLQLAEAPCISHLNVPAHLVYPGTGPDPRNDDISLVFGGFVKASSGDGLLLLNFLDLRGTAPIVSTHRGTQGRKLTFISLDPDVTRFVCNPLTGQLFRLPDIDGKKKTLSCAGMGILTQSERPHRPPDRFAVAELHEDHDGEEPSFVMRRFLSQTGKWDKLVGLPSPLPLARRMNIDHEVLAFSGRLWYVDISWGAVSADPFSDRPELRFVELPRGSVTEPPKGPGQPELDGYRRMGVSEGRLRYAEVSQKEPFVLSSFALDGDGSCWTLEHRVALSRLLPRGDLLSGEDTPRIGVVDPMNASVMHITLGNQAFSVDMDKGKVLACSLTGPSLQCDSLKSCVLPPWLASSRIPSAGTLSSNKAKVKSKTLSDILVRVDMDKKN